MFNNLGAALILLPICLSMGVLAIKPWQWGIVTATGMIQLALPYILFQIALRRVHAVDASLLILLEPVLNPVWVALATEERPDTGTIVGGLAILIAMVIEALKKPEPSDPRETAPRGFPAVQSNVS
jgi:drug/metabolite transporter (DMT)-like permease